MFNLVPTVVLKVCFTFFGDANETILWKRSTRFIPPSLGVCWWCAMKGRNWGQFDQHQKTEVVCFKRKGWYILVSYDSIRDSSCRQFKISILALHMNPETRHYPRFDPHYSSLIVSIEDWEWIELHQEWHLTQQMPCQVFCRYVDYLDDPFLKSHVFRPFAGLSMLSKRCWETLRHNQHWYYRVAWVK